MMHGQKNIKSLNMVVRKETSHNVTPIKKNTSEKYLDLSDRKLQCNGENYIKINFINSNVLQNVPHRTWDSPNRLSNGNGLKRRRSRITDAISPFHTYLHGENRELS